jgi:hypothetical protein
MLYIPGTEKAIPRLRAARISRAAMEGRAALAVDWLTGNVELVRSLGLAERIFQAPASRIKRRATAAGYPSNRKLKTKSLAEIWRSATAAERAEFLRVCGAELWVS